MAIDLFADTTASENPGVLAMTERAAARIKTLVAKDGRAGLLFRVSVSGGGCSGFQYHFDFDETRRAGDVAFDHHGVTMVIDPESLAVLDGSEVDYVEELIGASFRVANPKASSTCGCGVSFSL